jgi:hypothetical protein
MSNSKGKKPDFYELVLKDQQTRERIGRLAIWEQSNVEYPNRPVFCGNVEIDGKKFPIALWAQRDQPVSNGEGQA